MAQILQFLGVKKAMPTLFKGVRFDSHWYKNNAKSSGGFTAQKRGDPHTINGMMRHIMGATHISPYISLTVSYAVAYGYAAGVTAGTGTTHLATPTNPGYIYMIDLPDPLPPTLQVFDPIREIGAMTPPPLAHTPYQHEGKAEYLFGIINAHYRPLLLSYRLAYGGTVDIQPHAPSQHLLTLVNALRDAELLVYDWIPSMYISDPLPVS